MTEAGVIYSTLASLGRSLWPGSPKSFDYFFTWDPPRSPFSTFPSIVIALASYLAIVHGLRVAFDNGVIKPPHPNSRRLKTVFVFHNVALSLASGLLLAAIVEEVVPILRRDGFFPAICDRSAYTPRLVVMYQINYFFKFYELIDTIFLVVKRKPLGLLHPYHHAATAFLGFVNLHGQTSIQWTVIVLNLAVHMAMYGYYALMSLKIPCPWKRLVTTAQITQFVLDIGMIYFATYTYFASTYAPSLPHMGKCPGSNSAAFFGCSIVTSYLYLFVDFYKKTYNKQASPKIPQAATSAAEKKYRNDGLAIPTNQEVVYENIDEKK